MVEEVNLIIGPKKFMVGKEWCIDKLSSVTNCTLHVPA